MNAPHVRFATCTYQRTRMLRCLLSWTLALLVSSEPMLAQIVTGTLLRADSGSPASGVIVVATRPGSDALLARALSGELGRFSIRVPAGPVRLRALRIGQRPVLIGEWTLAADATRDVRVILPNTPVLLQAMTTTGSTRCRVVGSAGEAVVAAFEEARKALMATQLTFEGAPTRARYRLFTLQHDLRSRVRESAQWSFYEGLSSRPFQSLSPDLLARVGYVTEEHGGTVYRAPDAEVLLSDAFAASHCLFLRDGVGDRTAWFGLGFRPVADRNGIVDISGTLWFDRGSTELRRLEFTYTGVRPAFQRLGLGGVVEYARLPDGTWFVSNWEIRMPRTAIEQRIELSPSEIAQPERTLRVTGLQVSGGDVWRMTRGEAVLFTNGQSSEAMEAAAAPRVSVDSSAARWLSSDTLTTLAECGRSTSTDSSALVFGIVYDDRRARLPDAVVTAEWKQEFRHLGQHQWVWQTRQLTTQTALDGYYSMCGVPRTRMVKMNVQYGIRHASPTGLRIADSETRVRVDLHLPPEKDAIASGRGSAVRVLDPLAHPIAHALVEIDGGRGRVTDDSGRVYLAVASDSVRIVARRIGFAPFSGVVRREASGRVFTVTLNPMAQTLGVVTIRTRATVPLDAAGFYDRMLRSQRGAFVSEFVTPEELESRTGARIRDLLAGRRLVGIATAPGARRSSYAIGRGGCKMTVLVDGRVQLPEDARGSAIVSIDDLIDARSVLAIEIYGSATTAPVELQPLVGGVEHAACGVVAIWSGRR